MKDIIKVNHGKEYSIREVPSSKPSFPRNNSPEKRNIIQEQVLNQKYKVCQMFHQPNNLQEKILVTIINLLQKLK